MNIHHFTKQATQSYTRQLENLAQLEYESLDDEKIIKLVAARIRMLDKYDQESAIKDSNEMYHLDVLDALEGHIDALELGQRIMNNVVKTRSNEVIRDYEEEVRAIEEIDPRQDYRPDRD